MQQYLVSKFFACLWWVDLFGLDANALEMAVVFGKWDCQFMSGSEHSLVVNSSSSESFVNVVATSTLNNGEYDCLLSTSDCPVTLSSVVRFSSLFMLLLFQFPETDSLSSSFPFTPARGCGHVGKLVYISSGSRLRLFSLGAAFLEPYKNQICFMNICVTIDK